MKKALLPILSCIAAVGIANAATIINWQGDYVVNTGTLAIGSATASGTTNTWQYSSSVAKSPSSSYNGTVFYGAIMNDSLGGPQGLTQAQLVNNAAGDRITIGSNNSQTNQLIRGLIFFKKEDFSSLSEASNITFDSTSSITIVNAGSSGTYTLRAAVLDGTQWYVSQTAQTSFSGTLSIADASSANWGAWDPTGAPIADDPSTFTTVGSSFTNIQAVGYFFEAFRSSGTNSVSTSTSQITFLAIPEPSTWALLAVGLTAVTVLRRRRTA